ncbi:restriction endonuclease, partial [Campylobacter lari]|nr:restriction endonuclease [Campylobacter lari]
MIEFSNEERENFIKAIDELIKQVDDCIDRNKKTKNGKISSKGTTCKIIESNLKFLKEKYNYLFKQQIGNSGGTLSKDAWIIFVRKELLNKNYINSEKFTAKKGIYIFIGYSGYFDNKKHLKIYFDFPD